MCNSCGVMHINGVLCHETGCPDAWKEGTRECKWCGGEFKPEEKHQDCCGHSCSVAYHNLSCDCNECNHEGDNHEEENVEEGS